MPFTFAHPAIVLPLNRLSLKWFSWTGLIIGSMTPDFEYFIMMHIQAKYGHNIAGLLYFDLPLGIILAFLFHDVVKRTLINHLPRAMRGRFDRFKNFDWNTYFKAHWLAVSLCLIIGACSHLFWDAFTHEHGYFVTLFPALAGKIHAAGSSIPVFKILQHSSTIFGAIVIIRFMEALPFNQVTNYRHIKTYWIYVFMITAILVAIRIVCGLKLNEYGDIIVTGIAGVLLSLIIVPFIVGKGSNKAKPGAIG